MADTEPQDTAVESQGGTPILGMGGDLKNGAEHEPAISHGDFAGSLWFCGSVCDADHGPAVAHPDISDHSTAATELSARAPFTEAAFVPPSGRA